MSGIPLKRLASIRVSNVDKKSVDGQVAVRLCNYTDVYYRSEIEAGQDFMAATATVEQARTFRLHAGDVIITKDSEIAEDIGVPAFVRSGANDLICGYHLAMIRPGESLDGRFLYWVMSSTGVRDQLSMAATGVTRFGLRAESIGAVKVPVYAKTAQRAITDYLDTEIGRLDALIAKKDLMVSRLEERISAMVREHVGRSAIADGGEDAKEIRRLLRKVSASATVGEIVTAYRDGQVTARSLRRAEGYTESGGENVGYQRVRAGDVVAHGLDGFAGAIGTSEANGICSPVYHVMEPTDGGDSDFYGRLLRELAVTNYIGLFATSTRERAVDLRNWDLFGRIPIPKVPVEDQREIGRRIRALRPLKVAVAKSEALAAEHRQALITAAVTGELEIPPKG